MHALLEKTLLKIDVLRLDIRFDERTRDELAALLSGKSYSARLARRIVPVVMGAEGGVVQMQFKRDVTLEQWLGEVRKNLSRARKAGLIDSRSYRHVSSNLRRWFTVNERRGFKNGDRLIYAIRRSSLRTVLISNEGSILLDQTDKGSAPRRALLAGLLAPGSSFREELIRSLFRH
jgi:hypothetical protein